MKTINEERLFKLLPFFFDKPSNVIVELAQNASRAGATKLDITLADNILKVSDDGRGTDNPEALLVLADSDWTKEVEENQNPAGWGIFFLISISETIIFTSNFGSLEVDCDRYLNDKKYRENILQNIIISESRTGFHINAKLRQKVAVSILSNEDNLSYFNLTITVNSKEIKKKAIQDVYKNHPIALEYQGNTVYINPHEYNFPQHFSGLTTKMDVCWHGIRISILTYSYSSISPVAIDVKYGSPLTPVLPYRHSIKEDEKLSELWEFIRTETVRYCIKFINDESTETNKKDSYEVKGIMKTMSTIATQEEVDGLNKFYVEKVNPYYSDDSDDSTYKEEIIHKGENVVSEKIVKVYDLVKKEEIGDFEDILFLPEDTIESVSVPIGITPEWLKIEKRDYTINLDYDPNIVYRGFFDWHGSTKITCNGKNIKILSLINGLNSGDIYYSEDPSDICSIDDTIFARQYYSDDGDSWDTQAEYFQKDIDEDIAKIKNVFNISDLIGGMKILNIFPYDVSLIKFTEKQMIVETKQGSKTFNVT